MSIHLVSRLFAISRNRTRSPLNFSTSIRTIMTGLTTPQDIPTLSDMYAEGKLDATSSAKQEVDFKPSSAINDKVSLWWACQLMLARKTQASVAGSDALSHSSYLGKETSRSYRSMASVRNHGRSLPCVTCSLMLVRALLELVRQKTPRTKH